MGALDGLLDGSTLARLALLGLLLALLLGVAGVSFKFRRIKLQGIPLPLLLGILLAALLACAGIIAALSGVIPAS